MGAVPLVIASRYNGPAGSGNGGYSAGRFAAASAPLISTVDGVVEVTLRLPPPLEVPLTVSADGEGARITDPDGALVASTRPGELPGAPVPPVGFDEAVLASRGYPGFAHHPFPTCFVCGPERAEGDGLRLFSGRLPDGRTATPFVPTEVRPELIWAALDCPGGWAIPLEGRPYVLGRVAARLDTLPAPGERCVVMGERTGEQGRKAFTTTSLYGGDGRLLATAAATWIAVA